MKEAFFQTNHTSGQSFWIWNTTTVPVYHVTLVYADLSSEVNMTRMFMTQWELQFHNQTDQLVKCS